jgi:hypothetical protein
VNLSRLRALQGSGSDFEDIEMPVDRFPFLPSTPALLVPVGWLPTFVFACRRLSCVVPREAWGVDFHITGTRMQDGVLTIQVTQRNPKLDGVLRKTARLSATICPEHGTPALLLRTEKEFRPHCSRCLEPSVLREDVQRVLSWRAGFEGAASSGILTDRVPLSLRESFNGWMAGIALNEPVQPWHIEGWIRTLVAAQNPIKALFR